MAAVVLGWDEFLSHFDWRQGEHITVVGPTGCGKSTLISSILPRRRYVCFMATKPKDAIVGKLTKSGYHKTSTWPVPDIHEKVVFAPRLDDTSEVIDQRDAIEGALRDIYKRGAYTVVADELRYLTEFLKLGSYLELLWQQGRTLGISVVAGAQRPARVPLSAFNQPTHLFLWRESDKRNLQRLSEIGSVNAKEVMDTVSRLPRHAFLYVNTREGTLAISKVGYRKATNAVR